MNNFNEIQKFSLLLASLGHDLDHSGFTNNFEIKS